MEDGGDNDCNSAGEADEVLSTDGGTSFRQGQRQALLRACREGAGADEMSVGREQETEGVSN